MIWPEPGQQPKRAKSPGLASWSPGWEPLQGIQPGLLLLLLPRICRQPNKTCIHFLYEGISRLRQEHWHRHFLGCFYTSDTVEWRDSLRKPAWLTRIMNPSACTCSEQAVIRSHIYSSYIPLVEFDVHLRVMRQPLRHRCWNQHSLPTAPLQTPLRLSRAGVPPEQAEKTKIRFEKTKHSWAFLYCSLLARGKVSPVQEHEPVALLSFRNARTDKALASSSFAALMKGVSHLWFPVCAVILTCLSVYVLDTDLKVVMIIWFSIEFPQPYLAGNLALVYFVNLIHHRFLRQLDVFSFGR